MAYSLERKAAVLAKMLPPNNIPLSRLAGEEGISRATLAKWRAEALVPEYRAAVDALGSCGRLVIGGKSMGGRVASMVVDELAEAEKAAGLRCLSYPFHPPKKPHQLRTAYLEALRTPALICQGTRDPFGTRAEVETYRLSRQIELYWLEDGDHDLRPRKSVSGFTAADHLARLAAHAAAWAVKLPRRPER